MTRRLRTAEPAVDELREAVRWYVADTVELINSHPEIGEPTSADRKTRRALVPRFPYQVVYRLRPDEIVIVAVAHLKRRPGYWKIRR